MKSPSLLLSPFPLPGELHLTIIETIWLQSPTPSLVVQRQRKKQRVPGFKPEITVFACTVEAALCQVLPSVLYCQSYEAVPFAAKQTRITEPNTLPCFALKGLFNAGADDRFTFIPALSMMRRAFAGSPSATCWTWARTASRADATLRRLTSRPSFEPRALVLTRTSAASSAVMPVWSTDRDFSFGK